MFFLTLVLRVLLLLVLMCSTFVIPFQSPMDLASSPLVVMSCLLPFAVSSLSLHILALRPSLPLCLTIYTLVR